MGACQGLKHSSHPEIPKRKAPWVVSNKAIHNDLNRITQFDKTKSQLFHSKLFLHPIFVTVSDSAAMECVNTPSFMYLSIRAQMALGCSRLCCKSKSVYKDMEECPKGQRFNTLDSWRAQMIHSNRSRGVTLRNVSEASNLSGDLHVASRGSSSSPLSSFCARLFAGESAGNHFNRIDYHQSFDSCSLL